MNEELTRYYETLQDRENDGQRVFFDLYAISNNGGNPLATPLVTVANAGKNASGADVFKKYAEKATERKYDALQIKEYSRINGEVTAEATILIPAQKGKRSYTPKKAQGFPGLGALGYEDLGSYIEEKSNNLFLANRESELKSQLSEARAKITVLEGKLEGLKTENEDLKYKNRDLEYENKSIQRDAEAKNTFSTLLMNGVCNYIGTKAGIDEKQLQGLLGITPGGDDDDTDTDDQPAAKVGAAKTETEEDRIINTIVNKLYDFDTADSLNRILAIVELCAKSPKLFEEIFDFSKRLYKANKQVKSALNLDTEDDNENFSGEEDGDNE